VGSTGGLGWAKGVAPGVGSRGDQESTGEAPGGARLGQVGPKWVARWGKQGGPGAQCRGGRVRLVFARRWGQRRLPGGVQAIPNLGASGWAHGGPIGRNGGQRGAQGVPRGAKNAFSGRLQGGPGVLAQVGRKWWLGGAIRGTRGEMKGPRGVPCGTKAEPKGVGPLGGSQLFGHGAPEWGPWVDKRGSRGGVRRGLEDGEEGVSQNGPVVVQGGGLWRLPGGTHGMAQGGPF
jgi:hypothetical protein